MEQSEIAKGNGYAPLLPIRHTPYCFQIAIVIIWYSFNIQRIHIDGNQKYCQSIIDSGLQKICFSRLRNCDGKYFLRSRKKGL
jgi:hypothetical protein